MSVSPEDVKAVADNGPFVAKNLIPTLWMIFVASAGGVVSFYHKMSSGKVRAFNFTEFIGELVTSALAGLVTFWLCKWGNVNEYATAAGVAIAGHMGARLIFLLENKAEALAEKYLGANKDA